MAERPEDFENMDVDVKPDVHITSFKTDPQRDNEPEFCVKIYGFNQSLFATLDPWVKNFPIDFPGFNDSNRMKSIDPEMLDTKAPHWKQLVPPGKLRNMIEGITPLSELAEIAEQRQEAKARKMTSNLCVTVIAKKKVQAYVTNNSKKIILFGRLLVADDSGYCMVKFANTSIAVIYDELNIGDKIVITVGQFQSPEQYDFYEPPADPRMKLEVTLKLTEFDAYNAYKVIQSKKVSAVPEYISDARKLWTPTAINFEQEGLNLFHSCDAYVSDVIGVISHVSRLERFRLRRDKATVEMMDGTEIDDYYDFSVVCWIEIVDGKSEVPIPIKLHFNSNFWSKMSQIVTGSAIVVTNVFSDINTFATPHLVSSNYSQVYINEDIKNYLYQMGKKSEFVNETVKLFGYDECTKLFNKTNLSWTIGGAYSLRIISVENFLKFYYKLGPEPIERMMAPNIPLQRRETQTLIFRGMILRYRKFKTDWDCDFNMWDWVHPTAIRAGPKRSIEILYDPFPLSTSGSRLWSMFARTLPPVNFKEMPVCTSAKDYSKVGQEIYEKVNQSNQKFAKSLRMPAGSHKELKKLPAKDGSPHYAVDIWNLDHEFQDNLSRQMFTWKPNRYLCIEEMERKLDKLEEKEVLVLAQIHRTESIDLERKYGYDLLLHDVIPYVSSEEFKAKFKDVPDNEAQQQFNSELYW